MAQDQNIQSVQRALQILYAVGGVEDGLTVTQIANRTGIQVSSVYKFVKTMEQENLLLRKKSPLRYVLGKTVHELATLDRERLFLGIASEVLIQTQLDMLEAGFHLLERDGAIVYRRLYTDGGRPGMIMKCRQYEVPLYNKVSSLLLLAYANHGEREEIFAAHPFEQLAGRNWESMETLEAYLMSIKLHGCSTSDFIDPERQYYTVAAPILNENNEVRSAVGGSILLSANAAERDRLRKVCLRAAGKISERLREKPL